jgi:hypothetical protein
MRTFIYLAPHKRQIFNFFRLKNRGIYIFVILFCSPLILKGQYRYGENLTDSIFTLVNSKNGILYAGIDNPVEIRMKDDEHIEDFILDVTNGIAFCDSLQFITIPVRSGISRLILSKVEGTDTILKGHRFFQVRSVPDPLLKIDTSCFGEESIIYKHQLLQADSISIYFSKDIAGSENWFRVKEYSLGYIFGGFYRSYSFKGNKISNATKIIINRISPGKVIVFKIFAESEGKVQKELPVYRLKMF